MTKNYYKLRHLIPNCDKKLLQITAILLQIAAKNFFIKNLLQIAAAQIYPNYWGILQIALIFITNYAAFAIFTIYVKNYYKLQQVMVSQKPILCMGKGEDDPL